MATRAQKTKVGVFLVMCFALIASAITIISNLYEDQGIPYRLEFKESVLGLYEGGIVQYTGVPVGKVTSIRVSEANSALVEISIDPRKVQIREGVMATLVLYSFAAGTMAVELSGGPPDAKRLAPESTIPTKPSTITAVSTQVESLVDDLNTISNAISTGLQGMKEGDLNAIIRKVDGLLDDGKSFLAEGQTLVKETTGTVAQVRDQVKPMVEEMRGLSADIRELSRNANQFIVVATEKLEQLDVPTLQDELKTVLANLASITDRLKGAIDTLESTAQTAVHGASTLEYNLRATLREATDTLESTRIFIEQLKQDPASIIRGKGSPKEPKP